jgi:hypothetical protein
MPALSCLRLALNPLPWVSATSLRSPPNEFRTRFLDPSLGSEGLKTCEILMSESFWLSIPVPEGSPYYLGQTTNAGRYSISFLAARPMLPEGAFRALSPFSRPPEVPFNMLLFSSGLS